MGRTRKGIAVLLAFILSAVSLIAHATEGQQMIKRVPAEWEPQEAIWMQWPGRWEKDHERAFAEMAGVISRYETLHILYHSEEVHTQARKAIRETGSNPQNKNIHWHLVPYDNAWMRDNGPVYVSDGSGIRIQNWKFDAWGGAFGAAVSFAHDNVVPDRVGTILDMPVDQVEIVHERGNLEFNGVDTVILNWSTIGDPNRNASYSRERAERDLRKHFGVSNVIFIEGVPSGDRTSGHIDGIARFIDRRTVVVLQCTSRSACRPDGRDGMIFDRAAETIRAAGLSVIREPIEGTVSYNGRKFDTNYMNWLVGNGFVIVVGFGNPETDMAAKSRIEGYFPNRDVHVIEMLSSWAAGGGAHCHTNDQPAVSTGN